MAGEVGTAYVGVEFQKGAASGAMGGLQSELTSALGPVGGTVSSLLGSSLKVGIAGAVAGAVVVIGKALYDIGAEFDALEDTIASATGATGKSLEGLVDSAKTVATEVPVSFEQAGEAIAGMRAKTGLSGQALEDLTGQVLALSKVTEQDLGQTIESTSRLLGDWGLKGRAAGEGLDELFRASQQTGVETNRLADLMVKFGGPFRQLGFDFQESAALLGKWQKEGVNTELVAGSMRIALGKFAKAGREPAEAFRETIAEIERLGPGAKATGLAIQTFGARAGPDMAAAIHEGRFAIDGLVKSIENGKSTIKGTEQSARDFGESWLLVSNQLKILVGPAATAVFAGIGQGMAELNKQMPAIRASLAGLAPAFESLKQIAVTLSPVFQASFGFFGQLIQNTAGIVKGALDVIVGALTAVAALLRGDFAGAWEGVKTALSGFGQIIETAVLAPFRLVDAALGGALTRLVEFAGGLAPVQAALGLARDAVGLLRGALDLLRAAFDAAKVAGQAAATFLEGVWNAATGVAKTAAKGVDDALDALKTAFQVAKTVGGTLATWLEGAWNAAAAVAKTAARGVDTAVDGIKAAFAAARAVGGTLAGWLEGAWNAAAGIGKAAAAGLRDAVDAVADGIRAVRDAGTATVAFLKGAWSTAWNAAAGPVSGVASALGSIIDALRSIISLAGDVAAAIRNIPSLPSLPGLPFGLGRSAAAPAAYVPGAAAAAPAGLTALAAPGGGGGGLAGPVPFGQRMRAAFAGLELAPSAGLAGGGGLEVRVFIGDTELRGLVRTEVVGVDTETARVLLAGVR